MTRVAGLLAVAALVASPSAARAQLLRRASDAVRGHDHQGSPEPSEPRDRPSASSDRGYDDDDDRDYDYDYDDGGAGYRSRVAPDPVPTWNLPAPTPGDPPMPYRPPRAPRPPRPPRWVFPAYPYADDAPGELILSPPDDPTVGRTVLRLRLEGGYVLAGAGRLSAGGHAQLPIPLDIALEYSAFFESLPEGVETLLLGRMGLAVRLVTLPEVQVRLGGAMRHFHDAVGSVLGADGELGVDVFPIVPLVLSADVMVGVIGEAALVDVRASLGFLVDGWELYAGYRYIALLGANVVELGGPTLGIRGWL